jgi:hypothetical protein
VVHVPAPHAVAPDGAQYEPLGHGLVALHAVPAAARTIPSSVASWLAASGAAEHAPAESAMARLAVNIEKAVATREWLVRSSANVISFAPRE